LNRPAVLTGRSRPGEAARFDDAREVALIKRVANRDMAAFEQLYRRFHPRLARFLLTITHRTTIADEVLNDTMMVLWEKAGAYRGDSRPSTWLFAIAYRKAVKALRRQDVPLADPEIDSRPSTEDGPDQEVGRMQAQRSLIDAMAALTADHRAVIDLTYFHGLGTREIAEIMDCPVDTVKTRMFHARRHLKRLLAGDAADWLWDR